MKKILIIDDLKSDLILIKNIIETNIKNVNVLTSTNGVEGLQIAKTHQPDAIILDIYMPGLSGYDVATKLKKEKSTKYIPIIMLTANYEAESSMSMALNSGADVFLYKPINRVELVAQLNAILRLKSAEDKIIHDNIKLKQSEEAFKNLISDLPLPYAIHIDGKVMYANQKALELIGAKSEKEITGVNLFKFLHPDVHPTALENLKRLYSSEIDSLTVETIFVKLDGTPIIVKIYAKKVFYQGKQAIQVIIEDIDEKRKKEKEREQLIAQLEISEELSNSGSWRFNLNRNKVYFSKNMLEIHELTREDFDGSPDLAFSFIHPEDKKRVKEATNNIVQKENRQQKQVIEYRIVTKKGKTKYVVGSAVSLKSEDGKLLELFGTIRDITKEKLTEVKLQESEKRFGIAFELNPDPVSIVEIDSEKYVAVNNVFEKESGYSKEEIIGKTSLEMNFWVNPEDRKKVYELLDKNNGKIDGFETRFRNKNGEIFESILSIQKFQYNGRDYLLSIAKDITKFKETQRRIEKEKKKLNSYITVAQVMMLVLDKQGNITLINKKGCEILGYSEKELIGKNWFDNFLPKKEIDETKKVFNSLMKGETAPFQQHENYIVNAKGEKRLIAWYNSLVRDEKGQITGTLSSGEDITEKRRQENELKKAKEEAMESDRLKSAFLANMSHEIRTPMNAILGFTQLLKDHDFSEEEKANFVDIISKSGHNLLELINQIIDISKIEAGEITIEKQKTNLNEINSEIGNMFQILTDTKGIKIIIENGAPDEKAWIMTDKLKLKQILINLVNNAIKYTARGYVKVSYSITDDKIKYTVEDTGSGIPEDDLPYVFERFRKVIKKNHPVQPGAGLGLSIVKSYIELLGGEIFVESKVGKGSKFLFTLPFGTN